MSKAEKVETELRKLSQPELRRIRDLLDDIIEGGSVYRSFDLGRRSSRPAKTRAE